MKLRDGVKKSDGGSVTFRYVDWSSDAAPTRWGSAWCS